MSGADPPPLLVGEIYVDFTLAQPPVENKLRLGGVAHAARGFWAFDAPFSAAVVLPAYLEGQVRRYLQTLGCVDVNVIGYVRGAPNVGIVSDPTEIAKQRYEILLREEKVVDLLSMDLAKIKLRDVLVFPGTYDLASVCATLSPTARLHIDAAYDVSDPASLANLPQRAETIFTSTSSPLFESVAKDGLNGVRRAFAACAYGTLIFKENRGGARMVVDSSSEIVALPAQLGITKNSVGVGDVFDAAYLVHLDRGYVEAGWRASYAAAAYSQTTFPDLFKTYVQRDLKLSLDEMRNLWGAFLPWEERRKKPIYLAAPDFIHSDRVAIDSVIASLISHNFFIRRPIAENGELPAGSSPSELRRTYQADYELLKHCAMVFAVPTARDPGALLEAGIAIEAGIPVVVYDPKRENANTMVMAGVEQYSSDLDECLNAVFRILSEPSPWLSLAFGAGKSQAKPTKAKESQGRAKCP